jgi:predicted secreted Zn-dependent protease
LRIQWEAYENALLRHEQQHKEMVLSSARSIENQIYNIKPELSCKQLEINANSLGYKLSEELTRAMDDFDCRTLHGSSEGASFP